MTEYFDRALGTNDATANTPSGAMAALFWATAYATVTPAHALGANFRTLPKE